MESYEIKKERLLQAMDRYTQKDCMVAFSGGADSSLLLKLACDSAQRKGSLVYAVTIHTRLHPVNDLKTAERVAREAKALHVVLQVDELEEADISDNPVDRCYRCKKCMFQKLKNLALEKQIDIILEGTNEEDLHQYRPGIKALRELKIISPLAEAGLIKKEIRVMAGEYGLSVANRPASPCLATRFPYGTALSYNIMRKVEDGEAYIRDLGFYNVRLRIHGDIVRLETDVGELEKLIARREEVISKLKALGFTYITIDLEGFRSGSMDVNLKDISFTV